MTELSTSYSGVNLNEEIAVLSTGNQTYQSCSFGVLCLGLVTVFRDVAFDVLSTAIKRTELDSLVGLTHTGSSTDCLPQSRPHTAGECVAEQHILIRAAVGHELCLFVLLLAGRLLALVNWDWCGASRRVVVGIITK